MYKTIDEIIEEHAAKTLGGLSEAKKKLLKESYEREEKANGRDFIRGYDDGEEMRVKYNF